MLDFGTIGKAEVTREPFEYFCAPSLLHNGDLADIGSDFPKITKPGIFPLEELDYGPAFGRLIDDIRGPELERILAEKFDVELQGYPLMVTVRGQCQKKDGRIHTDSKDKIVTCLLYLNEPWDEGGGRLRLLRNGEDIEDYLAEIPPNGGTLVAFKRSDCSWHGHKPFIGQRRYVMFNWIRSDVALAREVGRHRLSARLKRLNPFS